METRGRTMAVCGAILLCGGAYLAFQNFGRKPIRVDYNEHESEDAVAVEMNCVAATPDLETVPETLIPQSFSPGDLVAISGTLVAGQNPGPTPVVVKFLERKSGGKTIVSNSAVQPSEGGSGEFVVQIKAPVKPGKYSLIVSVGGKNAIARGEVVVRRKL